MAKNEVATATVTIEPMLIKVAEAEALCNLSPTTGYQMVKKEWADFVVRSGTNRIRINRAKLLAWVNGEQGA